MMAINSRFRFICHPRLIFNRYAAGPPSIASRLQR
jgi:hypothetical protein